MAALRDGGFQVRHRTRSPTSPRGGGLVTVGRWELARTHASWFRRTASGTGRRPSAAIREGQRIDRAGYRAAVRRKRDFTTAYAEATAAAGVDVWLAPAATQTAPAGLDSTGDPVMGIPFSLAGRRR